MTANGTTGGSMNPMTSILTVLYKVGRVFRRILLGGLFVIAAGVVAVATTFLGVLVAVAALMLRIRVGSQAPAGGDAKGSSETGGKSGSVGVTLEARQTGEGWTVE